MTLATAPYHSEIAYGPVEAAAYWVSTSDAKRLRIAHWPLETAKGSVLIFPGRTEFVEKYGQIADQLAKRGFASAAIDWRGQGLSDRLLDNPLIGHVDHFADYQKDVSALVRAARELNLPRPYFLLAHSMGGAIGLRALIEGLSVSAVVFSGPMWGIRIAPHLQMVAWFLSHAMPQVGQGHRLPPGSTLDHHVLVDPFEGNLLTRDRAQFEIMREQLTKYPQLRLGGPSYIWLREALLETRHLTSRPSPDVPCVTFLGSNERIVSIEPIQQRMKNWPGGRLELVPEGEHEVLMESATVTSPLFDMTAAHFQRISRS